MEKLNYTKIISKQLKKKVMLLDGAMGTAIQELRLSESAFRGEEFAKHKIDLKGNNDLLSITQPAHILKIHRDYLKAGADFIETNTFNSNRISMKDYGMEELVYRLNLESAKLAVKASKEFTKKTPEKPRFVIGSIGPSSKTLSMSPDVSNPSFRAIDFDQMKEDYKPQIRGLIDGGAHLLMVETVFDTLNAKAVLIAIDEVFAETKIKLPIMLSITIVDMSGRTLSGQTLDAFFYSVKHFDLFSIGINCSLGAKDMFPYIKRLSEIAPLNVSLHPNAGLPNQFGNYDESPRLMSSYIKEILDNRLVNIIGGCCGTTPEHIAEFNELIKDAKPRKIPNRKIETVLSGLEVLKIDRENNFINIGERTNVFGSKKFAELIKKGNYEKALSIARSQIKGGAQLLDINMDDPLINQQEAMTTYLNLLSSEPEISRFPIMLDSSNWETIEAGLKCIQGKPIINSISLKEGKEIYIERAKKAKLYGAAVVVMAFDEKGQATSYQRKIDICKRSYDILIEEVKFPPEDIIFDPNILTIATGMSEHNYYADNYIKAVKWIKENLPYTKTSGGISNLSFSFRGNNYIREALHSVFLLNAVKNGLDMGIVNSTSLMVYDDIPEDLRKVIEQVLFKPNEEVIEELIEYATKVRDKKTIKAESEEWRTQPIEERLKYALIHGNKDYIKEDIQTAMNIYNDPVYIIETLLMNGMKEVGKLFDSGKMFLPQVIKSARVMKGFVDVLMPEILKTADKSSKKKHKVLIATVKGDVHDIGKNIISLILSCNQFEIVDLGVMVPLETILKRAEEESVDIIALSGLITPSLGEMANIASEMERRGFKIPLLIGGATTTELHTALKLAPLYSYPVIHITDASKSVQIATKLMAKNEREEFIEEIKLRYDRIREEYENKQNLKEFLSIEKARENRFKLKNKPIVKPSFIGNKTFIKTPVSEVKDLIDWTFFFMEWELKGKYPEIFNDKNKGKEAKKLFYDANKLLDRIIKEDLLSLNSVIGFYPANSIGDDVEVYNKNDKQNPLLRLNFLRNQNKTENNQYNRCLSDYIAPKDSNLADFDYIGFFALTAGVGIEKTINVLSLDEYETILLHTLTHRLAEAYAEYIHREVRVKYWGYAKNEELKTEDILKGKYRGIRPAPGYAACPDHREKEKIFNILKAEKETGIKLTENFVMVPTASICGYYFSSEEAKYFNVGKISKDQVKDYAKRREETLQENEKWLKTILNYK